MFIRVGSIFKVFSADTPIWHIIYTILGIDGWLTVHGVPTFSLGVGEWFLGALLILYLLFPVLRYLMLKNKKIFFLTATCIYLYVIYNYTWDIQMHMNLIVKGYEFIIGMLFGTYFQEFNRKWMLLTIPTVLFFFACPIPLNCNYALKITVLAVAFFVSFSFLENILAKHSLKGINALSKYSYELFLVHHVVITGVTSIAAPYITGILDVIILFVIQLAIMAVGTVVLKFVSDKIIHIITHRTPK